MARLLPDDCQGRVGLEKGEDLTRWTVRLPNAFGSITHVQLGKLCQGLRLSRSQPRPISFIMTICLRGRGRAVPYPSKDSAVAAVYHCC